ncbi:MAG: 50S ribosomal protein L25 [Candidatus Omnitrophota bacterium]|nr:50S ribosomal protein L25 [Candidatus Omnitrophota bacterium]
MTKAKTTIIQQELLIQRRTTKGSRAVRRLRQGPVIPGIVYGRAMEPLPVAVPRKTLAKLLQTKAGEHALVTLRLEDGEAWEKPALIHELQHDPVDGHVIHVDFHAIALTERIHVKIPVVLKGEPVGVKLDGGILEQFLRELEVDCLPTEIPEGVEVDVTAMKIGDTLHVRDLIPPKNAKLLSDPAGAIASVQQPKVEKPEEEAAAITEPEVLREKKEEGKEAGGEAAGAGEAKKAEPKAEKKEKS